MEKNKNKNLLIIGPFSPPISGPGVKNDMMKAWIRTNSSFNIKVINTQVKIKSATEWFKNISLFLRSKNVLLSVSKNGRFLFIPLCYITRKNVILFPAGGFFDFEIESLPRIKQKIFLRMTKSIKYIYAQTITLQSGLNRLELENIKYFPNPRVLMNNYASTEVNGVFKIVFLSKIRKTKGALILIKAIERVLKLNSNIKIELDFYGAIDESFSKEFVQSTNEFDYINYKGIAEPSKVQYVISQYNLFVLPTYYKGEGVPGALIEAMMTGIPIVTTDFRGVDKLITNQMNGIVVAQKCEIELAEAILSLYEDENLRGKLSQNVLETSKKFDIESLMPILIKDLNSII